MSVAILGGGISGLTAGRRLRELGVEIDILEAAGRAGGLCASDTVDGYVIDHSGGHIVFSKSAKAMDYYHSLFEDEPMVKTNRNTRILYKGTFIPYPFENGIGELSAEDRLRCLQGTLDAALGRSAGAPKPDNFRDWIDWHIGSGIGELFMNPYNQKIWELDDLSEMGISWVDGRVPEAPISDIVKAALGETTVGYAHQAVFWYPLKGGFQAITDRIADHVKDRIHLNTPVTDISKDGDRVKVNGKAYDAVISTVPMSLMPGLIEGLDSTTSEAASKMGSISLACFLFGISGENVPDLSWIYLPHANQGPANRVTYLSNYSPQNAPTGRASLMAEVTYRGSLNVDTDYIRSLRRHLAGEGLFNEEDVDVELHRDNRFAYIHYDRDYVPRRQRAIDGLEEYGVIPLGRFGRYNYYNTDLCILEALDTAEALARKLGVNC